MSSTRIGVLLICSGSIVIGAAYLATMAAGSPPEWGPWALALGGSAASVALFVLGAAARGPIGRGVALLLTALGVVIAGAFCLALALPPDEGPGARLVAGLPLRLAVVFLGVGFIPLFVLPVVFARTFARGADQ